MTAPRQDPLSSPTAAEFRLHCGTAVRDVRDTYIELLEAAITALREALAKPDDTGCKFPICHNKEYQDAVAAQVMAELYTGVVVPPGYALVPVEPTPKMLEASFKASDAWQMSETKEELDVWIYRAMLAAAPQPKDKP